MGGSMRFWQCSSRNVMSARNALGRCGCVRKDTRRGRRKRNGSVSVGVLALTAVPELPELGPVLRIPAFGLLFRGQRTIAATFCR